MPARYGLVLTILVIAWTASTAHAQVVATPYLHVNFGDVEFRRGGWGVSIGYLGDRLGFELDVDRHHHFFKDSELESVPNPCMPGSVGACIDSDTEAWIVTGNAIARIPTSASSSWRPYGLAGVGVVHAWIHDAGEYNSDQTNLGLNLGGGVMYWINDWLAIRADARYFHVFVDESEREGGYYSDYDFGRVSLGLTFGYPR